MTESTMLRAALAYAGMGWAVIPLHTPNGNGCSCGRPDCGNSIGKHPRITDWENQASSDQATIRGWWRQWPDANVGIACGPSKLISIDLDIDEGYDGLETWRDLRAQHQIDDEGALVNLTGSGGQQLIFASNGWDLGNTARKLGPGIDTRGSGGLFVAPPSIHRTGKAYAWEVGAHPGDIKPAPIPEQLTRLLQGNGGGKASKVLPETIPDGQRDTDLTSLAGTLRNRGMEQGEILEMLRIANRRCEPPKNDADLERIAKSVSRYEPGQITLAQPPPAFRPEPTTPAEPEPAPPEDEGKAPELAEHARLPADLSESASPWLDEYITFSRRWSPRAYDGFHEAIALWLLSTVAARRVMLPLGPARYTPLSLALCARTSLFAKSTTADIGIDTLKAAGLDWLLAADTSTPQKFIHDLTARVPDAFDKLPVEHQERTRRRLALAGQRGWFYEEFGQHLYAMGRTDGVMADFRGILRRFDDCKARYESGTIARGNDVVERPYLALLVNLTPADLRPMAQRGGTMWNDGFWARFAFITPGDEERKKGRFPHGFREIPRTLTDPLIAWHSRLGVPDVLISDDHEDGKPTGRKRLEVGEHPEHTCTLGDGVYEAYYRYHDAMLDLVEYNANDDFDGNYARFAEKALRISILLGSLENNDQIAMRHWARGQEIAERWRIGLHQLYQQINAPTDDEEEEKPTRILMTVRKRTRKGQPPTAREIAQYTRGVSTADVQKYLPELIDSGDLAEHEAGRTKRYTPPGNRYEKQKGDK